VTYTALEQSDIILRGKVTDREHSVIFKVSVKSGTVVNMVFSIVSGIVSFGGCEFSQLLFPRVSGQSKNRRIWNFFANRLGKWSVKTDGMEIFMRTVWENGASKPTERKFFGEPSVKMER
jgi:hypothetical protein